MKLDKDQLDKMTLREVMKAIEDMTIADGALVILFDKAASEIERLDNRIDYLLES